MSDWITVTLGYNRQVRVRRSAILSYGAKSQGSFIDLGGKEILVIESEAELAALIGDADVLSKLPHRKTAELDTLIGWMERRRGSKRR